MLRLRSIRIKLIVYTLIPILVFGIAYRLARVFFPATEDATAAYDELFSEEELMGAVREKLKIPLCAGRSPLAGFGRLTRLQRSDPTFGYHGSGARLGDLNRVLVHWSTVDGRSRVIFCDLSHREVDGGELLKLLSPWQTVANQCVVRVGSGGSGTVVSPKGLIVTADHVLPSNGSRVDIRFADGHAMTSTVVGQSKRFDVAVLKIPVDQSIA